MVQSIFELFDKLEKKKPSKLYDKTITLISFRGVQEIQHEKIVSYEPNEVLWPLKKSV